ncbi:MAG TPA: hypothetical protein DEF27_08355 [Oscillatoriales bacterium UBA8482]|nr:MAG: hypothetical protein AUK43_03035 [Oscillatoriales cyanobacterium CG2_30_40_61]HBW57801.1 hypothetical protein [Oscillatoriales bacterium UBA8482]
MVTQVAIANSLFYSHLQIFPKRRILRFHHLLRNLRKSIKGAAINVILEQVNLPKALVVLIDPQTKELTTC